MFLSLNMDFVLPEQTLKKYHNCLQKYSFRGFQSEKGDNICAPVLLNLLNLLQKAIKCLANLANALQTSHFIAFHQLV